jgi:hypothetical protein
MRNFRVGGCTSPSDALGLHVSPRVGRAPASPKWALTEFGHVRYHIGVISDVNPADDREPAPLLLTVSCSDCAGHLLNLGENILLALKVSPLVRELPLVNAKSYAVNVKSVENNCEFGSLWIRGAQRYHGGAPLSGRGDFNGSRTRREFINKLLEECCQFGLNRCSQSI